MQVLADNKTAAQLQMAELKRNLWVSPGTRVVIIDFTVYNVNLNHWAVVRQTFEFAAAGGIKSNSFYTVTKLMRYQDTLDYVVFGAEVVMVVFLVFYAIEEIVEMCSLGKQYFKGFFNNTDYTVILLCSAILAHRCSHRPSEHDMQCTVLSGPSSTCTWSRPCRRWPPPPTGSWTSPASPSGATSWTASQGSQPSSHGSGSSNTSHSTRCVFKTIYFLIIHSTLKCTEMTVVPSPPSMTLETCIHAIQCSNV